MFVAVPFPSMMTPVCEMTDTSPVPPVFKNPIVMWWFAKTVMAPPVVVRFPTTATAPVSG